MEIKYFLSPLLNKKLLNYEIRIVPNFRYQWAIDYRALRNLPKSIPYKYVVGQQFMVVITF